MIKDSHTHHISQQFNAELEEVRSHLLEMGGLVEKQVNDAVTALIEADSGLAQRVREVDDRINQMERNIDEECLRILARRQPAASDLRLIISISKSVIDLERIGDESTKIARRAIQLCEEGESPRGYVEVRHISDQVSKMVRDALDSFARFDADLALSVAQYDKNIDREYKTALRELVTYMMEDPRSISRVLNVIWVLRSLERIGDHARNISELVIYLVRGTDVRHLGLKRMQEEVKGLTAERINVLDTPDDK
ncbi:phosphate signaling complex protein PhoU [Pseudomonas sp. NPDC078416]|jgi:phosphate transport system protein|uniref:Phosphate-specific transport system accessory protein PhoU n=1 Tax=Pseudomonas petrae TaxID=2912190 RepID=A0ABS9HZW8_9PSED|nr:MULTISPECIES: phosphate signaling complex protein PhoU [Pseudomonas]MBD8707252.1 phosphate signaling complex protein PhoU [Pseudomonas sp. CFBP 13711]MBD8714875.1 phosphate signaling complex protein PhoU [Pseudomonas sp. CFBP 13715]MCF7531581.1 phosphate signaling complex protein PhoU [Pseudomonas petrae]MCF7537144.1 phosphate signaling complex protein PhoU [Pseudomonas petrae]MCF7540820.1 phosphate signaling complex protein PhoU [Pseudomonas petrae]